MTKPTATALLALLVGAGVLRAQIPAGPEFQVNTYTTNVQSDPSVAMDEQGRFIVSWQSDGEDGDSWAVVARTFDAAGTPLGTPFQVNGFTAGGNLRPAVAARRNGEFAVAWEDRQPRHIVMRRFDLAGAMLGSEFRTSGVIGGYPAIAADEIGQFVVAFQHYIILPPPTRRSEIHGQRFDTMARPVGSTFKISPYAWYSYRPSAGFGQDDHFVVVWHGTSDVYGRRFLDSNGETAFRANSFTTAYQANADIATDGDGNFVVVWNSLGQDGSGWGVFGQRHDAAGGRRGSEFRVNDATAGDQLHPSVASDPSGNFLVAWEGQDGSGAGVFARRFDAAGTPFAPEFRVNTYTTGNQGQADVAADRSGNFVVAWSSPQDGSGDGTFAQRLGGLVAEAIAVDAAGNGVIEPGETVAVEPSWRNVSGQGLTFGGAVTSFSGPPGADYGVVDGAADYGSVANGATSGCGGDCYALSVSDPPVRPAGHWDAHASESLTPTTLGPVKRWSLHVGRSFGDVPVASPFYRFVETLLHRGVTGGCAAGVYCPASPVTREQMAVFVLVAREARGFVPEACGVPVFADVPASSPYCRWIEELARRGVVAGCAPGLYCPVAEVSREQMAVFVLRTLDPLLNPPPCAAPNLFHDVPESSPFCRWIEELAARGVVSGCGGGNYCPTAAVAREQMAVFLGATFGLTLYGP